MSDSMIGRYLAARDRAIALGDAGLVGECEFQLRRLGWRPDAPPAVIAVAERAADAEAKPAGRPSTRRAANAGGQ